MTVTSTFDSAGPGRVSPGQVELILSQIESLPTLPPVAARLLEMTTDDRVGTGQIAALVESDQTLSARILSLVRRANSGSDVQTVDRAVVLLGSDAVRSLVLGIQIFEVFGQAAKSPTRFDREGFWKHCLAVGCAARLLAEVRLKNLGRTRAARMGWPTPSPEEAFVCGLLHDLGKVVFDACFPKSYDRVVERVEARHQDIAEVEREVFGVDHAAAGHRLALHWKLPTAVAECMWLHHHTPQSTPTRIGYPDHVMLVQTADRLVRQMCIGYSGNYGPDSLDREWLEALGLTDDGLKEVMPALPDAIEQRAELLGLGQITSREVLHETLVRTNAELARVNTSLTLANRSLEQRSRTLEAICTLNRGLGEDCRHQSVLTAAVQALQQIVPQTGFAMLASSPARQITLLAVRPADQAQVRLEVLDNGAVGNLSGLQGTSGRVSAENHLPGAFLDRLNVLLGETPKYCRAVRCAGRISAAVIAVEPLVEELDRAVELVGDWAAPWLEAAESVAVSNHLTEELAGINAQLVKAQSEAARMRSLAMVGEMAAGAAHELNNPLAVISGRAQILARGDHGEQVTKSANLICEHAHRASDIVNELMEFAKPSPAKPTAWAITELLGEVRRTWLEPKALAPEEFVLELSDDLPQGWADAAQIRLLFDELIRNAVEAMKGRDIRRLTINCRGDVADDRLVVRIEDNGCGMTPDVLERATDPFFSYRPAGRGRGLGLSRAARYAQINGGTIRLSSRVKEGTAVILELPVATAG